jgi:NADH-quinone oxidoreductase subunit F
MERLKSIGELDRLRTSIVDKQDPNKTCVTICGGTGCSAFGSDELTQTFIAKIKKQGLEDTVDVKKTGCHGFCERGPVVVILPKEIFYQQMVPEDVPEVVSETLAKGTIVDRLLYEDPVSGRKYVYDYEVPFYKKQLRNVLADNGLIDPTKISDYIGRDGYQAMAKALTRMTPEEVIDAVETSGLSGRGGAGFPTGTKWRFARQSPGEEKYLICNADEGDPGAFMDRSVLEGNPHAVIEGMIISAYAIGAREGYIYVRAEYPLAVQHLHIALSQAEELGLLGKNMLGSGVDFTITIKEGAGAFVCGEETALIASVEGKRGMPRTRPPFPAQSGLGGKPSNINNVETFANVRLIILKGPTEYASLGTEGSKGTKIFSVTGRINNTGLVEVPMGVSLREIIYGIGGGIPKGRRFKAVQMGGPSGGCVPEKHLDLPVDYESLKSVGAMMGSGGMIVMDENICMVDIARFFLNFTQSESCGKCTPCRLGTRQMLEILTRITQGKGREGDIEMLLEIARAVKSSSLCGLGQTASNPVLSTIQYFRDEYEAHIKDKHCPGAVCEALVVSACQHTCPVGINVPKYVAAVAAGNYVGAAEIIRETNPFPAICGRICHHPCEIKCRRGELDEAVAIRSLKRFAADSYFNTLQKPPAPFPRTKHQKVAIVGAGPNGLTCAFYLARMGYPVTVFEALPVAGGMLMVGVPEFRLPKAVIQKEIEYIQHRGVEIQYNTPVNVNFTLEDIQNQGYEAIFIAAGAQKSQKIRVPGEDENLKGLFYGLSFLRDAKLEHKIEIKKRSVVVGGGNVAIDAARTLLRLGSEDVTIIYRRTKDEMPAIEEDIEETEQEGIKIQCLTAPVRILSSNGSVCGVECIRMKLGDYDESGRRRPVPIDGTEFTIETDIVIPAVGQAPDLSFLPQDSALERTKWETLQVNSNTLATNIPGIFAGGDFVTGPTFLVEAIAGGRRGAVAIDRYLRGDTSRIFFADEWEKVSPEEAEKVLEEVEEEKDRVIMPTAPPEARVKDFREIELGFSEEQAHEEARRCLRCDLEK